TPRAASSPATTSPMRLPPVISATLSFRSTASMQPRNHEDTKKKNWSPSWLRVFVVSLDLSNEHQPEFQRTGVFAVTSRRNLKHDGCHARVVFLQREGCVGRDRRIQAPHRGVRQTNRKLGDLDDAVVAQRGTRRI